MKYPIQTFLAAAALIAASAAHADSGTFGSYVSVSGSYYQGTGFGAASPALNGANLGSFAAGSSLLLDGAELFTYKNNGSDVTGAELDYSIDGGAFVSLSLPFGADNGSNPGGTQATGGGDQLWGGSLASPANLLAGLGAGSHSVTVYFKAYTSDGDKYDSNGGNNYTANFSVTAVPEPSSYALLLAGLGSVALITRRRKQA